jgi:hypothetical protein
LRFTGHGALGDVLRRERCVIRAVRAQQAGDAAVVFEGAGDAAGGVAALEVDRDVAGLGTCAAAASDRPATEHERRADTGAERDADGGPHVEVEPRQRAG